MPHRTSDPPPSDMSTKRETGKFAKDYGSSSSSLSTPARFNPIEPVAASGVGLNCQNVPLFDTSVGEPTTEETILMSGEFISTNQAPNEKIDAFLVHLISGYVKWRPMKYS